MVDRVLVLLAAWAFAVLFAGASWHKLRDAARFRAILAGYQLLPAPLVPAAALAVPLLEALLAAGLLLPGTRAPAAAGGVLLLLAYALAIGANLVRGRRDLSCGCGRDGGLPIAGWMVVRNVLLAALLAVAASPPTGRALEGADGVTLALGTCALALVYAIAEQLLATATRTARAGATR